AGRGRAGRRAPYLASALQARRQRRRRCREAGARKVPSGQSRRRGSRDLSATAVRRSRPGRQIFLELNRPACGGIGVTCMSKTETPPAPPESEESNDEVIGRALVISLVVLLMV